MPCRIAVLKVSSDYFSPAIGGGQVLNLARANLARLFMRRVEATKRDIPGYR